MMIGSGGVIALVIGLWGALWAWRVAPATHWRGWLPELSAFLGAAWATALLDANAIATNGWLVWARAAPEARPERLAHLLGASGRPFLGFALGALALGAAVAATRHRPGATAPERRRLEHAIPWATLVCAVLGLACWATLRSQVAGSRDLADAVAFAPRVQGLASLGAAFAGLLVLLALLVAALRVREMHSLDAPPADGPPATTG